MQIIILAAGEGKRISSLTNGSHKSLLPINSNETFFSRLLHQLNEYEISKVIVVTGYKSESICSVLSQFQLNSEQVHNSRYKEDTNILSVKLAIEKINYNEPVIIIESDIYLDDLALKHIYFESKKNKSIWFTRGKFNKNQYGGILKSNVQNKVQEIRLVDEYLEKYSSYYKLLGITAIGTNEIEKFSKLIDLYHKKTIKQYYLIPWIENLDRLPSFKFDLEHHLVYSFNRQEEYYDFIEKNKLKINSLNRVELIDINLLYPIEKFIKSRVEILYDKIVDEKLWSKPIIIDDKDYLIMDGHHRFEVAKKMKVKKIPVVKISYSKVQIWSLKESEFVNKKEVRRRALINDIYPHKTVKHNFDFEVSNCNIKLEQLR